MSRKPQHGFAVFRGMRKQAAYAHHLDPVDATLIDLLEKPFQAGEADLGSLKRNADSRRLKPLLDCKILQSAVKTLAFEQVK